MGHRNHGALEKYIPSPLAGEGQGEGAQGPGGGANERLVTTIWPESWDTGIMGRLKSIFPLPSRERARERGDTISFPRSAWERDNSLSGHPSVLRTPLVRRQFGQKQGIDRIEIQHLALCVDQRLFVVVPAAQSGAQ